VAPKTARVIGTIGKTHGVRLFTTPNRKDAPIAMASPCPA
jgi:hypothetical protein